MEKANYSQLELFSQAKGSSGSGASVSHTDLSRIWRYEKTILILIGFITVGIASFSLGVEKGKHSVMVGVNFQRAQPAQTSMPSRVVSALPAKTLATQPVVIQKQGVVEPPKESPAGGGYTIQVASFQVRNLAQKEAEILKGRGHATLMLSKSGYIVLCVGRFSDKNTARSLLQELKKRYGDCYIRRL